MRNATNCGTALLVTLKANLETGFRNPTVHGMRSVVGSKIDIACESAAPNFPLPRTLAVVVFDVFLFNVNSVVDERAASHGKYCSPKAASRAFKSVFAVPTGGE